METDGGDGDFDPGVVERQLADARVDENFEERAAGDSEA